MRTTTKEAWRRERRTKLRLTFHAEQREYGSWHLACEIETADLPVTVYVPPGG